GHRLFSAPTIWARASKTAFLVDEGLKARYDLWTSRLNLPCKRPRWFPLYRLACYRTAQQLAAGGLPEAICLAGGLGQQEAARRRARVWDRTGRCRKVMPWQSALKVTTLGRKRQPGCTTNE